MKKATSVPKTRLTKPVKRQAPRLLRKEIIPTPAIEMPTAIPAAATEADVARRAYEIFLGRNGEAGDPIADWLQAEQELTKAS